MRVPVKCNTLSLQVMLSRSTRARCKTNETVRKANRNLIISIASFQTTQRKFWHIFLNDVILLK
jgi:hypothetical protein